MKAGYRIEHGMNYMDYEVGLIECRNLISINTVQFIFWPDTIYGPIDKTVAIFKIKPKNK